PLALQFLHIIEHFALTPRHTGTIGGFRHRLGDRLHDRLIKDAWNDVLLVQLLLRDDVGNVVRRGALHLIVDHPCPTIQGTTEDAWKTQHIVDLVRIVRTTRGHNAHIRRRNFRHDLWYRVGHGKHDGVLVHFAYHLHREGIWPGQPDEHIRSF